MNQTSPDPSVRFGIPQLDEILGACRPNPAENEGERKASTLAILGPDGTGKSVFAMHLASTYMSDAVYAAQRAIVRKRAQDFEHFKQYPELPPFTVPRVLYVSTDLSHHKANIVWKNFWLDFPWARFVPFDHDSEIQWKRLVRKAEHQIWVNLVQLSPPRRESLGLVNFLRRAPMPAGARNFEVGFLDLATDTAGDDWNLLLKIVAATPRQGDCAPDLLIVDSVAGFETLIGDIDSFGQRVSRRTRIAQLIRAAENWNVAFIVEEPKPGEHHPEEFVTDLVLRLRRDGTGSHTRRHLEIEKARARAYGIGEHPFEIRDGAGTSTGAWQNPDDPKARAHSKAVSAIEARWGKGILTDRHPFNGYVQIFPSLHYRSREFGRRALSGTEEMERVENPHTSNRGFGIPFLDNLLSDKKEPANNGLVPGRITALIGTEGTRRTLLARSFLRESYAKLGELLVSLAKDISQSPGKVEHSSLQATGQKGPDGTHINQFLQQGLNDPRPMHVRLPAIGPQWRKDWMGEVLAGKWRLLHSSEVRKNTSNPCEWEALANVEGPTRYMERVDANPGTPDHRWAVLCTLLREIAGLLHPTVLVTTEDYKANKLAAETLQIHMPRIEEALATIGFNKNQFDEPKAQLAMVVERLILVRRVELHDATTPQIFHVIERAVMEAMKLLPPARGGYEENRDHDDKGLIRVVIGDLTLFRNTFPDILQDKLFLPTVVFRLRRWGVTALLVDAADGRPDHPPADEFDAELRSLTDHQIYTWHVNFFGENRVAIAPIPPLAPRASGIIRELAMIQDEEGHFAHPAQPKVNPHFELYSGIETGEPEPIPLKVLLYEETKAFQEYTEAEKSFFSHVFSSLPGFDAPVIQVRGTRDYEGLRDYCQLPTDTRLPYTLVFAVDGFWSLGKQKGALRNQSDYLHGQVVLASNDPAAREYEKYLDVFRLYRETNHSEEYSRAHVAHEESAYPITGRERASYFRQIKKELSDGQKALEGSDYLYIRRQWDPKWHDRVPFTWDFGFLLCNQTQWEDAGDLKLTAKGADDVRSVWDSLPRILTPTAANVSEEESQPSGETLSDRTLRQLRAGFTAHSSRNRCSWRAFFEACRVVADVEEQRSGKPATAFDLSMTGPESLLCLWFEIWASEIAFTAAGENRWATRDGATSARISLSKVSSRSFDPDNCLDLVDWLSSNHKSTLEQFDVLLKRLSARSSGKPATKTRVLDGFALELYKTWLLVSEVLPLSDCRDPKSPFQLHSDREPNSNAVATRHWYKTACIVSRKMEESGGEGRSVFVPTGLPGNFATRGDWFLAVAQGSRSQRLGDLALDMLTSRRANRSRLYLGLGLPTRDLIEGEAAAFLRTRLTIPTPDGIGNVLYGDLTQLGGSYPDEKPTWNQVNDKFWWLYRSSFKEYDRQAATLRRWIGRVLTWTIQYRHEHRKEWKGGFLIYDRLTDGTADREMLGASFLQFAKFVDMLIADLKQCRLKDDDSRRM